MNEKNNESDREIKSPEDRDLLYDSLRKFALRRVGRWDRAEDLVQEAYLRLAAEVPPIVAALRRAWLYRVLRNLIVDSFRRKRLDDQLTEVLRERRTEFYEPDVLEQAQRNEENLMVLDKIKELDTSHREALRLKFQEGLTYDEIATVMNKPRTTVAWLLHESLTKLRKELNEKN